MGTFDALAIPIGYSTGRSEWNSLLPLTAWINREDCYITPPASEASNYWPTGECQFDVAVCRSRALCAAALMNLEKMSDGETSMCKSDKVRG